MNTRIACYLAAMFLFVWCGAATAAAPCCAITAIDQRTGIVTAVDSADNSTIQFKPAASLLRSLKVGQKVYVDPRTRKVSLDGAAPCCNAVSVKPAEPVGKPTTAVPASTTARPAEPVSKPNAAVRAAVDPRPAEPAGEPQASSQAASSTAGSNPLGSKRGLPPIKADRPSENPGRGECADKGGEWRCTTVSTGSDPGTDDDLLSCVCINR
jgi:hypothetical protein